MDVPQGSGHRKVDLTPIIHGITATQFPPRNAHRMTYELGDDEDDPRIPATADRPFHFNSVPGMDFSHLYPSMFASHQDEIRDHFARLKAEYDALDQLIEAEALDLLVAEWSEWQGPKSGERVLHAIVTQGSLLLLQRALRSPLANCIDWTDRRGQTALFFAVKMGDLDKARVLLEAGALIRCKKAETGFFFMGKCPFELTVNDESMDMAVLLLTAQGRTFPDGHDEGCCKYQAGDAHLLWRWEDRVPSDPSPRSEARRAHIMRCGQELHVRRTRSTDAFYAFLFCVKRGMTGANSIIYREMVLPMLQELWKKRRYDVCWKDSACEN